MRTLVPSPSRRTVVVLTLVAALVLVPAASALAAVDMFIKIPDIDGESKDKTHKGEIDVLSWSWGMSNAGGPATGGGAGVATADVDDVSFVKVTDKATPKLMEAVVTGEHIPEAVLTLRDAKGKKTEYLIITMKDVLVTSYSVSGSGGEDRPTEQVTLNFAEVEVVYTEDDGTAHTFAYDLVGNIAL